MHERHTYIKINKLYKGVSVQCYIYSMLWSSVERTASLLVILYFYKALINL
jgi:hypothetical protein